MKISSIQPQIGFSGKYKDYSYITDPSSKFYAGMTLKEAEQDGTDHSFWYRDFHNLDKDKDGVLSVQEIFDERNREISHHKISALIFTILGGLDLFLPSSGGKNERMFMLLLDAAFILSDLVSIHNIKNGNKRYERMLEERSAKENTIANA